MKPRILSSLLLLVLFLVSAQFAVGQATANATILGTATDSTGAVVVGAEVTATNKATGVVRSTVSNASGDFRFD